MYGLGSSMTKLKLPKTISKDFFVELAHAKDCICGRCIGESEKKTILENAEKYLEVTFGPKYMKIPSLETRAKYPLHAIYVDTQNSYENIQDNI